MPSDKNTDPTISLINKIEGSEEVLLSLFQAVIFSIILFFQINPFPKRIETINKRMATIRYNGFIVHKSYKEENKRSSTKPIVDIVFNMVLLKKVPSKLHRGRSRMFFKKFNKIGSIVKMQIERDFSNTVFGMENMPFGLQQ